MANKRFDVTHVPGAATIAIVTFLALYIPVLILVVNAFNGSDTAGRWEGLSLRWFAAALDNAAFRSAAVNSVIVALAAALLSTCLATAVALAVTRGRQIKGQGSIVIIVNQPLLVPEIVFGIALMVVLAQVKQVTGYQGLGYLIAAHTTFAFPLPFADPRPPGGHGPDVGDRVDGPLCRPVLHLPACHAAAVAAGHPRRFHAGLRDLARQRGGQQPGQIAGPETLPTYLMGELRRNLTSEIYAISALLLFASISIVAASWVITRTKQ